MLTYATIVDRLGVIVQFSLELVDQLSVIQWLLKVQAFVASIMFIWSIWSRILTFVGLLWSIKLEIVDISSLKKHDKHHFT